MRLLADGQAHSGEAIASAIGISRTAVWKILHQLDSELGLGIESARGQGYRLPEPLHLLSQDAILAGLSDVARQRLAALEIHDEIDSTNAYLLERGRRGMAAVDGARLGSAEVCLAERQTAGRGRLGRRWVSPFGRNLYLSILWRYALAPAQLGGLSLACGIAVAQALEGLGVEGVGIKWPNDIHWQRRKLAGLLLEVAGEAQGPSLVVVGVGLNLRLRPTEAAAIDQPWVDLSEVCGEHAPERNAAAAALIERLVAILSRYADDGLASSLAAWHSLDTYRGEPVTLLAGEQRVRGVYRGVDAQGNLLLEADGGLHTYAAGEVSLRPLGSEQSIGRHPD